MRTLSRGTTVVAMVALAILASAPAASATFPGRNGLIAFQAQTEQGLQIFTVRANGHQLRQITHVDGDAAVPDWSPDGRRITFTLNECSVAIMDADGSDLSIIAKDPALCQSDSSFTPDGSRLVYIRYDPARDVEQIWSMKVDGSDKRFITGAGGPDPNVSPDGRKISFKGPPDDALFVASINGSGVVQISPSISVTYKHDWSPDGRYLVVSDKSDPTPNEAVNVVTVRPDGSDWTYLTHYPAGFRANVGGYSPDGKWIVFRLEGPGLIPTMYRIRPDGSGIHKIFQSSTIVPRFIDWGPAARH